MGIYQKTPSGLVALASTAGKAANVWWFDSAPNDAIGLDGDMAIRTDTWDVYGKTLGSWGSPKGNIKGIAGEGSVNTVNGNAGPDVVLDADDVGARPAGNVPWGEVSGKPTTFTPSAHSHGAGDLPSASTSAPGIAEAATGAETISGADGGRYVTPAALAAWWQSLTGSLPSDLNEFAEIVAQIQASESDIDGLLTSLAGKQPLDATLTALAAVSTAANKLIYASGADSFATTDFTAWARTLLDDASASDALTTLGVSAFAKTLLDDADAAAARGTLGLGNSATRNVGTSSGSVAAGDDSRITGALSASAAPELIRDTIAAALVEGSGIDITVDDAGDTITIAATGGGSGGAALLAVTSYAPGSGGAIDTTSTTAVAMDATNLAITFTAPATGKVRINATGRVIWVAGSGIVYWNLINGSTTLQEVAVSSLQPTNSSRRPLVAFHLTGLTPGASYTLKLGHRVSNADTTSRVSYGAANGPIIIEAWEAPA